MSACTLDDLKQWFQDGVKQKATHMIVVCDTFDWADYPVYVKEGEDAKTKAKEYSGKEMQRVMEVYNLKLSVEEQMGSRKRVFNY